MTNPTTDTETRVRDYLETKANLVPDDADRPEFDPGRRHRLWPALVAAAAVLAVVGLIVPFVLRLGDKKPEVDPAPAPGPVRTAPSGKAGAVKSTPIELPFLVDTPAVDDWTAVLSDGVTRLNLPKAPEHSLVGRVAGGWVIRLGGGNKMAVAFIDRTGRWRKLSDRSEWAYLSPDRTKVVLSRPDGSINRLVVVDVATGREVHTLPAKFARVHVYGWNPDGIWFSEYNLPGVEPQPYLWQPGSEARLVPARGFTNMQAPGTTNRITLQTEIRTKPTTYCAKVVTVRDAKFVPVRERCATNSRSLIHVFLSPDGKYLAGPDGREVLEVDSGVVRRFNGLVGRASPIGNVYEDADHLLVKAASQRTDRTRGLAPVVVNRCNVRTGSCRVVHQIDEDHSIGLGTP